MTNRHTQQDCVFHHGFEGSCEYWEEGCACKIPSNSKDGVCTPLTKAIALNPDHLAEQKRKMELQIQEKLREQTIGNYVELPVNTNIETIA